MTSQIKFKATVKETNSTCDYLELHKNRGLLKLFEKNSDSTPLKNIFSDFACRINSYGVRKVRILVLSGKPLLR